MTIQRMDHVGVVVDDLTHAIEFFEALGLELEGRMSMHDKEIVDRLIGLDDVSTDFAFVKTPDGHGRLELIEFKSPSYEGESPAAPPHKPGIRHLTFAVDDIKAALARLEPHGAEPVGELTNYEDMYWLCYVRGPSGIIVELAEKIAP